MSDEMTTTKTSNSTPQETIDTHGYKGWLNSNSFLKRAFAIYGYNLVASLIISVPIFIIAAIVGLVGVLSFMGGKIETSMPVVEEGVLMEGKLDIGAICEGSLMYTTFASGAEADAYVEECKAGKHPEVIDRYKADMGLGDGTQV